MNKLFSSFFARLYGYIVIAMLASMLLTFAVLDNWNEHNNTEDFVEDTLFVVAVLERQRHEKAQTAQVFYPLLDSLLYPFEVNWINNTSIESKCADCEFIGSYKNVDVYERLDGLLVAVHRLTQAMPGVLLLQDKQTLLPEHRDENLFYAFDLEAYAVEVVCVFIILASGAALYLPLRQLKRNIIHLDDVSEKIGAGDFSVRANKDLPVPLNKLADRFNTMAKELSSKFNESQIFAQAVPHELRTPLSRIQLAAGILRQHMPTEEQLTLIDNIDQYIDDIDGLCTQIIAFSKLNLQSEQSSKKQVSLVNFINTRIQQLALDPDIEIRVYCATSIDLFVNEVNLRLVLDNLLKNAVLYAHQQVTVRIESKEAQVVLFIEDDGDGIPEQDRANIFIPFARLDKSRNRNTGGLGLGLAITSAATKAMHGSISVTDADPHGAKFMVVIPV